MLRTRLKAVFAATLVLLASCGGGDDDPTPSGGNTGGTTNNQTANVYNKGGYFIATKTADGSEWVMQVNSLTSDLNQTGNFMELPQTEYTWIFKDHTALGMVYQQQFAGIGYALRYTSAGSQFSKLGEFQVAERFSTYGFLNDQLVTCVSGQTYTDAEGVEHNDGATFVKWNIGSDGVKRAESARTISTEPIAANGEQITFSGIVDNGDGTFLTALVQSNFHQVGTGNGSSVGDVKYPDSCWVARMDRDYNVLHIYRDDRISYAAGHYRSQVLRSIFATPDGTTYVFSNAFAPNTTRKAGVLRIKKGAEEFDQDYYFDLQTPTGGYKFRRVWHMTGNIFLLEVYNDFNVNTMTAGHQFAVVDVDKQTLKMVTGLPAKNQIVSGAENGGVPMCHNGVIYLPITQRGQDASIYTVSTETAAATKLITLKGVYEVRSLGYIGD